MSKKHVVRSHPAPADAKDNGSIAVAVAPDPDRVPLRAAKRKAAAPKKSAKPAKVRKATKEPKPRKMSALDAAAKVIASATKPMRAIDMVAEMEKKGLWKSPGGKTPEASVYAAIIREIAAKKGEARFKKVDRGLFVAGKGA